MRRPLAMALAIGSVALGLFACSPPSRPRVASLAPRREVGALDAASPARRGDVTIDFFSRDGGAYWAPWAGPTSDARAAIASCYEDALRGDPTTAGWIRFAIPGGHRGGNYAAATFLDSSPVSSALVACVLPAIRKLEGPAALHIADRIAYVSLR